MSWLSKTAKKIERSVSKAATKAGVGSDLKKAANIFGAANVGGATGIVTGFLTGGAPGAVYGGITGGATAAYGKYKGDSSSKYISNAAGNAAIAGSVGPLIYKPAGTALITAPGPVSGYGPSQITVKTSSGGFLGSFSNVGSGLTNTLKDAVDYIGKGGLTQLAVDSVKKIFNKPNDPGINPDLLQGNAVPSGGTFPQWLNNVLPGKSYDPTAPGANTAGGGGSSEPSTVVEVGGSSFGGSDLSGLTKPLLIVGIAIAGFLLLKKGKFAHA